MSKRIIIALFFSVICISAYADKNNFIGAWYSHNDKLNSDIFLLVQDFDGELLVSIISDKSSVNVFGLGKYEDEKLIVFRLDNKTKIYTYDEENKRLVLSYTKKDGIERYKYYYKVDNEKLLKMKKSFLK